MHCDTLDEEREREIERERERKERQARACLLLCFLLAVSIVLVAYTPWQALQGWIHGRGGECKQLGGELEGFRRFRVS